MKLADLIDIIERSAGAVTVADLAKRLESPPETVRAMLAALRASGRLEPGKTSGPGTAECAASGRCVVACPGPGRCPFVVDLGPGVEIRRVPSGTDS